MFASLSPFAGLTPFAGLEATGPAETFVVYIDARAAVLISSGDASDPFAVDPRQAVLIASSASDPFEVDPRQAVLIQ